MSLTKSMNVQLEKTPGWAAALLFELYQSITQPDSFFVRTLFKNSTYVEDFYTLDVPGCGFVCSLEKFIEVLAPMAVPNYKEECMIHNITSAKTDAEAKLAQERHKNENPVKIEAKKEVQKHHQSLASDSKSSGKSANACEGNKKSKKCSPN